MVKAIKLLIFSLLLVPYTFAQDLNCDSLIEHFSPQINLNQTMETEFKIKIRLRNIAALINLKTQPLFTFPEYQALQKSVYQDENVEIIDSVYVILKSGLSWEINEGSPPKPKRFLFKFASKKRREEKPVKDYLDYLEFCSWCENHGIPNCIIEKFQRKSLIYINNKKSYQLKFYIKYNPDMGLVITDKSIKKY